MSNTQSTASGERFGVVVTLAIGLGAGIVAYGLLLATQSPLGGLWIVASGVSMVLSGVFGSQWAGDRWGLSPTDRRRLSLSFAIISVVLLIMFIILNVSTFESGSTTGSGETSE